MRIDTREQLRALYAEPGERARRKQLGALDGHCRRFIELSPFVVIATASASGRQDASPRGGAPGFVKVTDDGALLIGDAPGNNRLDTLENIVDTGRAGLLFLIPGFDETLRVNGSATLSTDAAHIAICSTDKRAPKLVICLQPEEAYLHCAKAFMRSRLWEPEARVPRSTLPTAGQMLVDHTGIQTPPETVEQMKKRYEPDL